MTTISKKADSSAMVYGRTLSWSSATEFATNDIIDVAASIGGAGTVTIETSGGASCTFRINALNTRYPSLSHGKRYGFSAPDLSAPSTWINTDAPTITMGPGEVLEINVPVANLQFTSVVDTVTVKVIA